MKHLDYKILVTGAAGQLGHDVIEELSKRGYKHLYPVDLKEFDLTSKEETISYIKKRKVDVIVHCAAYTNVNGAEDHQDICYKVNVEGTRNIIEAAKCNDSKVIYISTDYVFDGTKSGPYLPNDKPNPLSVYGLTKAEGEDEVRKHKKHFIIRTSWVYGLNGKNFIKTMLELSKSHNELTVVSDQVGSPTYTKDLSVLICDILETSKYGTYHATNEGYVSWADFARKIFKLTKKEVKVKDILTKNYKALGAPRPLNSRLSKACLDKAKLKRLPTIDDSLKRYLKEIGEIK